MNKVDKNVIKLRDIIKSLKLIPKTVKLILEMEKKLFIIILIISVITGVFPVISVMVSQELINMLILRKVPFGNIIFVFLIYILLNIINLLLGVGLEYCENRIQYKFQYKLNYKVMQKCSELSLADFENAAIYDRIEKINSEIGYKPYQILISMISLVTAVITMASSIVFLLSWNAFAAIGLLIVPVISMIYFLRIGEKEFQMHWKRTKDERKTWYLSYILTHDFSYKEVYLYELKDYILNKYWGLSRQFIKQNDEIQRSKSLFTLLYEMVVQGISAAIIFFAVWCAYLGQILAGNVMSYIRSISLIQTNSKSVMSNIYTVYNSALYMEMLFEFFAYKKEISKVEQKTEPIQNIKISNLHFKYPNGKKEAISNFNLELSKGEKLAIVGPNGSGKSTLIKILTGLYDIQSGTIEINGRKETDLKSYKKQMAVLFQDFTKYEFTLRENISMGMDVPDVDNKVREQLNNVHADFLKQNGEYNLDMQLGVWFEEGVQLSQGQWQKVALARAYFKKASVFILDEPNSALDPISEKAVFDSFFKITKDKIGVYISHKLNAAKLADKIVVVSNGQVVAVGKHDDLLETCKTYKEMYLAENYQKQE